MSSPKSGEGEKRRGYEKRFEIEFLDGKFIIIPEDN